MIFGGHVMGLGIMGHQIDDVHEWCLRVFERFVETNNEGMWDKAAVEIAGAKHDQVSTLNGLFGFGVEHAWLSERQFANGFAAFSMVVQKMLTDLLSTVGV